MACGPCAVNLHVECAISPVGSDCCCGAPTGEPMTLQEALLGSSNEKKERGGQIKLGSQVKDWESTGRKRAAKLYPIPKENEPGYPMSCEWRGLLQAGGGVIPIVGCSEGLAKAIHHGPNKNTLENSVGNVHRICATCHNRWHTINDQYYPGERPPGDTPYLPLEEYETLPHYLERATKEQIANSEAAWTLSKAAGFLHNLHQEVKLNLLTE